MAVFVCPGIITTPSFPETFADATWEQIIDACHQNAVPDTWVADGTCYKDMEINGTNYRIDIIGKNHDDYADGSGKAPLTFQMHDCYGTTYQMNSSNTNSGGWQNSAMRTTHLPALKLLLPAEVQAGIRAVNKQTGAGNQIMSIVTTSDELFILSESEIFAGASYGITGEGTQYEYYSVGNSKIKKIGSNANWWNERSPTYSNISTAFCSVAGNGDTSYSNASAFGGVPFAFCF